MVWRHWEITDSGFRSEIDLVCQIPHRIALHIALNLQMTALALLICIYLKVSFIPMKLELICKEKNLLKPKQYYKQPQLLNYRSSFRFDIINKISTRVRHLQRALWRIYTQAPFPKTRGDQPVCCEKFVPWYHMEFVWIPHAKNKIPFWRKGYWARREVYMHV